MKRIVLIAGPLDSHPATTHEYEKTVRLLGHCLETSPNLPPLEAQVVFGGWPVDESILETADTIVFVTAGSDRVEGDHPLFAGERLELVGRQMARGCGLAMIHWSTFAPLRTQAKILEWTGGFFDYESGPASNKWYSAIQVRDDWTVSPGAGGHPITNGVGEPFALKEEFYYKIRFRKDDPRLTPLWQVDLEGLSPLERTTAWCVERADGGRGFGTTGGHFYANWELPEFRKSVLNAIAWTAKIEVPAGGVESSMLQVEETRNVDPPRSIRALILTGNNHPAHAWKETTVALADVLHRDPRIAVDVTADPEMLAKADLGYYDVIIQNYCNWDRPGLSDAAKNNFTSYLEGGGGLVIVHYANGSWYKTNPSGEDAYWPEYAGRICRRYWDHAVSGHDAYGGFDVRITDSKHPVTDGLNGLDFTTTDELYFRQQGGLPIEALAVAKSTVTGAEEPMAFAYDYGRGRVFQTMLGHSVESITTPGTAALIRRAAAWAAGASLEKADPGVLDEAAGAGASGDAAVAPAPAIRGFLVAGERAFRQLPLEISCRARLNSNGSFNILVANEPKASPTHWELYTYQGTGQLSLFLPGGGGEFRAGPDVCDGSWHDLKARLQRGKVVLSVDGKEVLSRPHTYPMADAPDGGRLGIGRLVSGAIGCDGEIGTVSLSRPTVDDTLEALWSWANGDEVTPAPEEKPQAAAGPDGFPFDYPPVDRSAHPDWQQEVNATRLYDFYSKEADYFMRLPEADRPGLLPPFPGLEGGRFGHWGAKGDADWVDGRWNQMDLGPAMGGVFRGASGVTTKAVAIRLGDGLSVCFDPATLAMKEVWRGGFLRFDATRWGLLGGIKPGGETSSVGQSGLSLSAGDGQRRYFGYHRSGDRVVFSYRIGDVSVLDSPSASADGAGFVRHISFDQPVSGSLSLFDGLRPDDVRAAAEGGTCTLGEDGGGQVRVEFEGVRSLRLGCGPGTGVPEPLDLAALTRGGAALWSQLLETKGELGPGGGAYAIDTITIPYENPWNSLFLCSGHDFFSDGTAAVCTIEGDVWTVRGIDDTLGKLTWKRFAAGLHQPLGLVVVGDVVHVLGRDQITRLHDRDGDGEADFYECFTNAYPTSAGGHDFITGLERDGRGNLWFASTYLGVVRVAPDGASWETVATGLRNPNGLAASGSGLVTSAPQEGDWTPTSMICEVQDGRYFGYGGPKGDKAIDQPLCYLPRGIDHSSGGQVFVDSDRWGPLQDKLIHFSWGNASHMLVLRDVVDAKEQGAAIPLPGDFLSGAHRGRFGPHDGQLYVTGSTGWATYALRDGCFQRVRYTGKPTRLPVEWRAHYNGIYVRFAEALDSSAAGDVDDYFCQQWNYLYSQAYGSNEYSALRPGEPGHDIVSIRSAHLLESGRAIFLEIPELMPVQQLHLLMKLRGSDGVDFQRDLFATIHHLRPPFTDYPGYLPLAKTSHSPAAPEPRKTPIALPKHPSAPDLPKGREMTIKCLPGLKYDTLQFAARAGERISLTLQNDDVIPHNLAVLAPGQSRRIGELAAKMLTEPTALERQYVPDDAAVLWHTLVIDPNKSDTIHFTAPAEPGVFPYLCTFPGHWQVMLGEMRVTE